MQSTMRAPVAGVVGRTRCVAAGVRSCAGASQSYPNPAALCRDHPHASTSPHQCQRRSSQRRFSMRNTPLAGQASFATVGPAAEPQSESLAPGTGAQSQTTPGQWGAAHARPWLALRTRWWVRYRMHPPLHIYPTPHPQLRKPLPASPPTLAPPLPPPTPRYAHKHPSRHEHLAQLHTWMTARSCHLGSTQQGWAKKHCPYAPPGLAACSTMMTCVQVAAG